MLPISRKVQEQSSWGFLSLQEWISLTNRICFGVLYPICCRDSGLPEQNVMVTQLNTHISPSPKQEPLWAFFCFLQRGQRIHLLCKPAGCASCCGLWEWNTSAPAMLQDDCREHDWPDFNARKKSCVSSLLCLAARSTPARWLHAYSGVPAEAMAFAEKP